MYRCVGVLRYSRDDGLVGSNRVSANRTRTSLSALFSWAIAEGRVEANPVVGTLRVEEHSRERVLDFDELRLIWNALPARDYGPSFHRYSNPSTEISDTLNFGRVTAAGDGRTPQISGKITF